ncbi:MAG: hypothetical protein AAB038_04235 [Planctomycetota bacterium]
MGLIGFNVRLNAPYFTEIPPEIRDKWVNGAKKAVPKTYKGLKKAIKTQKDFKEKIADPTKKTIASFINPEWTSKHGLTYKDIMNKTRDSLAGAGKRYFRARKTVYESGKYEDKLEFGQKEYARKWCKYLGPLRGYKAGHILGLSTMAVMALTGAKGLVDYLKEQKVRVEGGPIVITTPEKLNKFRRRLDSRMVHWGSEIITQGFEEWVITRANEEINRLVNEYLPAPSEARQAGRLSDIAPFTSGGVSSRNNRNTAVTAPANSVATSHIDFIVEEMPNPTKPGERIKQLGLDIQVAVE